MQTRKFLRNLLIPLILSIILLSSCQKIYKEDGYAFTAPPGFKTKLYESYADSFMAAEPLLFSQNKHVYFQIFRQDIPSASDLNSILESHKTKLVQASSHYQFISQTAVKASDRDAIQYVYREFHGEPYIQVQEIWIEKDGAAYTLSCSEPVISTIGAEIPIAEDCTSLVEGFQFN